MKTQEQIELINDTINKTKENLKSSSFGFVLWGTLIAMLSFFHHVFPEIVQQTRYSTLLYWVLIPVLGMIFTVIYNIKKRKKTGYETHIGRALKIIWGVFNISLDPFGIYFGRKKSKPYRGNFIPVRGYDSYNGAFNSIQTLFYWGCFCHSL